jgi:hypothetical protein
MARFSSAESSGSFENRLDGAGMRIRTKPHRCNFIMNDKAHLSPRSPFIGDQPGIGRRLVVARAL